MLRPGELRGEHRQAGDNEQDAGPGRHEHHQSDGEEGDAHDEHGGTLAAAPDETEEGPQRVHGRHATADASDAAVTRAFASSQTTKRPAGSGTVAVGAAVTWRHGP